MNDVELELLLYRIFTGKLIFFYKNERYELVSPDTDTRYEAQLIYNNIINDEKYNDWIREENLQNTLMFLGLWTKDTMTIVKDIEKKIDQTKIDLYKSRALKEKVKQNKKALTNYRNQYNKIMNHKHELFSHTLEGYASSIKNEYIICKTLYNNGKRVFYDDITNNQSSYTLFNNLVNEINKHVIDVSEFKILARSSLWKSYWGCSKNNLFPDTVSEWSLDQRTLISISKMYDNIAEHPECPEEAVIEDDDMLDGWMLVQRQKIEKDKKQQKVDDMNPKLKNAQEVFLVPQSQEEIKEIIDLNSQESLNKIKMRTAALKEKSSIPADQLPDTQIEIRNQLNEMNKNRKK